MCAQRSAPPKIAVIGAGIGGLVFSLAMRQRGLEVEVFEQSSQLAEIGAAVALSANATRELERLGVLDGIVAAATEPTELIWRDGRDGRRIAAHPVRQDGAYRRRFGAPYLGIHRASLQKVLSGAHGPENLHLSHRLAGLEDRRDSIVATFENGRTFEASVLVGADGVRSAVRRWITGKPGFIYSGTSAFRGIVPTRRLHRLPDPEAIQFWTGADAHLLHYAIGAEAEDVNFFAVAEGPTEWRSEQWIAPAAPGEALAAFAGWHPAVTEMIGEGWLDKRWALFVVAQPRRWFRGRAVLLGDAAHGMLPHQGQGANTTIEDAVTLAAMLADGDTPDGVFPRYQEARRQRTRSIQRSSWATNTQLHLPTGNALRARDGRLARFPEDFGWIHAFDASREAG
jgi:salicylate hydroxylase